MKKILIVLITLISSCTTQNSTGFLISDETNFTKNKFSEQNIFYVYRTSCFHGAAANIVLELNNKFVGVLGSKQIVKVPFKLGINHLVASGDINNNSYAVLLDLESNNSKYFISSFCRGNKLLTTEYDFDDWVKAIIE